MKDREMKRAKEVIEKGDGGICILWNNFYLDCQ